MRVRDGRRAAGLAGQAIYRPAGSSDHGGNTLFRAGTSVHERYADQLASRSRDGGSAGPAASPCPGIPPAYPSAAARAWATRQK